MFDKSAWTEARIGQLRNFGQMLTDVPHGGCDAAAFDPDLAVPVGSVEEGLSFVGDTLVFADISIRALGKDDQIALSLVDALAGGSSQ